MPSATINLTQCASALGNGNTSTFHGGSTLAAFGTNDSFVFTPTHGSTAISGFDASDEVQFSQSTFADWQALPSHASPSGTDTGIHTDPPAP